LCAITSDRAEDAEGLRQQAVTQVALFGKLSFQDATEGSASELIEQLLKQKKELVAKKQIPKPKKLENVQDRSLPYVAPRTWSWVQLGVLSKTVEYGTSQKASSKDNGVPVFRMNNIQSGELLYKNFKYVSASIKGLPKLYLHDGDLLFNRTNSYELVGKTGVFRGDDKHYTFASYLIRISLFTEFVVPEFINLALNSTYFRQT
jgi:type I restriction enzyme S subunit